MKRSLLVLVLFAMFLGACSQYTCPTYASDTEQDKKEKQEERI